MFSGGEVKQPVLGQSPAQGLEFPDDLNPVLGQHEPAAFFAGNEVGLVAGNVLAIRDNPAGDVLKQPDSSRFESGGLGGWILFKKDSFSCLFSYS